MEWTQLTQAAALDAMPTAVVSSKSLKAAYDAWIVADTAKVGRLTEIRQNILNRVRDAIVSNRANTIPEDPETIPRSCVQAALDLIWHALAMEMGLDISNSGSQAMIRSDLFIRQIAYGHFVVENSETAPSPSYVVPGGARGRSLPVILIWLLLLIAPAARAGWIDSGSTVYDTGVQATYLPSAYTSSAATVYGHLQGINAALQGLANASSTNSTNITAQIAAARALAEQALLYVGNAPSYSNQTSALTNESVTIPPGLWAFGYWKPTDSPVSEFPTNGLPNYSPSDSDQLIVYNPAGSPTWRTYWLHPTIGWCTLEGSSIVKATNSFDVISSSHHLYYNNRRETSLTLDWSTDTYSQGDDTFDITPIHWAWSMSDYFWLDKLRVGLATMADPTYSVSTNPHPNTSGAFLSEPIYMSYSISGSTNRGAYAVGWSSGSAAPYFWTGSAWLQIPTTATLANYQTLSGFNAWATYRLQWVGTWSNTWSRNISGTKGQVRGDGGTNLFIHTGTAWARILIDTEAAPDIPRPP